MTTRHAFGPLALSTCAGFRVRLRAIGLGRWASPFTGAGARETESAAGHERRRAS
jgi:hypothetical protein